jgi:hypothetical protein
MVLLSDEFIGKFRVTRFQRTLKRRRLSPHLLRRWICSPGCRTDASPRKVGKGYRFSGHSGSLARWGV